MDIAYCINIKKKEPPRQAAKKTRRGKRKRKKDKDKYQNQDQDRDQDKAPSPARPPSSPAQFAMYYKFAI